MKKILLVEDDPTMRRALRLLLEPQGHSITDAADGEEAQKILAGSCFDLIVTDLFLRGISGLDIFRTHHHAIPVLIITGHGESPLGRQAQEESGACFLEKPFTANELLDRINNIVKPKEIS